MSAPVARDIKALAVSALLAMKPPLPCSHCGHCAAFHPVTDGCELCACPYFMQRRKR